MEALSQSQIDSYRQSGYLVLENRVPMAVIESIRAEIARFVEEARGLTDSNDRLDLEDSHTLDDPRLRRIKLPHKICDPVHDLLHSDHILAPVRDLIGPDLRLHTSKLNMKSAGFGAAVEWHQDFAFYPHTNDDVLAVGVLIDDMAEENGPLMVLPETQKGPILEHHSDGFFAGAVDLASNGFNVNDATRLMGPAGSISIHHGRVLHGSALNTSNRDRRMIFFEIMAADAFPVMGGMTTFDGIEDYNSRMLCGQPTLEPRLEAVPVRVPLPLPAKAGSIYEVQGGLKNRAFKKI